MAEIRSEETSEKKSLSFIEQIIGNNLEKDKNGGKVQARFPPEPGGYLHIGRAKAICLSFGIAATHGGICNLRFDNTNPIREDVEYVETVKEDIQWLGYQWDNEYYASDYFQQLWDFAIRLIKEDKAYIGEQTSKQIAAQEGTSIQPGVENPYCNHPIEETLELFQRMSTGEIEEGTIMLRVKVDMTSPSMHFRDPIIYRMVKRPHHRTSTTWKTYPMYDFAHGQSNYFEEVTHSLCTLEFIPHHPLYDLFVDWVKEGRNLNNHRPRQYEFNKLSLSYTLTSKRNLLTLVKEGFVNGWDDPRIPTICGFRHRGYSSGSIHKFTDRIGYTTYGTLNEFALLESAIRENLNAQATRISAVLNPVKLVTTNYSGGQIEEMEAIDNPERPEEGSHNIEFSRELWIERDDFMGDAPKKYFHMTPGQEVRLKSAYIIKCISCKKNGAGEITKIYYEYDPGSESGMPGANRKVKGAIHWISYTHCLQAEVRLYDRLWKVENPRDELATIHEAKSCNTLTTMREMINPDPLNVLLCCYIEKCAAGMKPLPCLQFQRIGYFNVNRDSTTERVVFNRIVGLKDT